VVQDGTGGGGCTGVLIQAGVDTPGGDTGRVLGAILVDPALHTDALDVGISLETRGTATGGLMVGGVALGVSGTRVVGHAGVEALPVCADLSVFTLAVRTATNRNTGNLRVSGETDGAVANWLVVPDEALGVSSTVAGVHTVPVVAGQGLRTVVICLTTNNNRGLCAGNSGITEVTIRTGTYRFVLLHLAEGIRGARIGDCAGVEALSVDAGSVWGALGVIDTLRCQHGYYVRCDLQTLDLGVACVADWAATAGGMQTRLADGVGPAGIYVACVPAGSLDTLVRVSTVSVYRAGGHWGHFLTTFSVRSDKVVVGTDTDDGPDG
jgi:hypothetical protein